MGRPIVRPPPAWRFLWVSLKASLGGVLPDLLCAPHIPALPCATSPSHHLSLCARSLGGCHSPSLGGSALLALVGWLVAWWPAAGGRGWGVGQEAPAPPTLCCSWVFSAGLEPSRLRWEYGETLCHLRGLPLTCRPWGAPHRRGAGGKAGTEGGSPATLVSGESCPPHSFPVAEKLRKGPSERVWAAGRGGAHPLLPLPSLLQGVPFPQNEANAMDVVIQYAVHRLGFQPQDIILYAWSIGGFTGTSLPPPHTTPLSSLPGGVAQGGLEASGRRGLPVLSFLTYPSLGWRSGRQKLPADCLHRTFLSPSSPDTARWSGSHGEPWAKLAGRVGQLRVWEEGWGGEREALSPYPSSPPWYQPRGQPCPTQTSVP